MGIVADWLQVLLSAVGGFMTAIIGAFVAAWNLSGQLRNLQAGQILIKAEMQKYIDDKLTDTRHTLYGRIDQGQMVLSEKMEEETKRLELRIREVERAIDRLPRRPNTA